MVWIPSKVGLDKALNLGILKCRNEIIFRADGDDINKTNRFEVQLPYLLDIYDIVGSYVDEYDEDDKYISTRKVPQTDKAILKMMPFRILLIIWLLVLKRVNYKVRWLSRIVLKEIMDFGENQKLQI